VNVLILFSLCVAELTTGYINIYKHRIKIPLLNIYINQNTILWKKKQDLNIFITNNIVHNNIEYRFVIWNWAIVARISLHSIAMHFYVYSIFPLIVILLMIYIYIYIYIISCIQDAAKRQCNAVANHYMQSNFCMRNCRMRTGDMSFTWGHICLMSSSFRADYSHNVTMWAFCYLDKFII